MHESRTDVDNLLFIRNLFTGDLGSGFTDAIIHNYVLYVEMVKSSSNMQTCVHKVLTSSC